MILPPLNDEACLGSITDIARTLVTARDPELTALAHELGSAPAVVRWLRSLPQRDDLGRPGDGPKVAACSPPQRLRLPAPDPNCVERATLYLVLGELLAPEVGRRLATVETEGGLHTLPVEAGAPVVLDPRVTRNAAQAGVDRASGAPLPGDLAASAAWACEVATEPAASLPGGVRRVRNARSALVGAGRGVPLTRALADDVALALALAAREARRWGPAGEGVVARVAQAVLELQQATRGCGRAAESERDGAAGPRTDSAASELRNGVRWSAMPRALTATLRALGAAGLDAGATVARLKLAALGLPPRFLGVLERELNREGLTLGPVARPTPPAYSFAALTKDAIAARTLERAGGA